MVTLILFVTNSVSKNLEMLMIPLKHVTEKTYLNSLKLTFSGLDAALYENG